MSLDSPGFATKVWSNNEWDPLEEVIVGRADFARIAKPDLGLFALDYRDCGTMLDIPSGAYSKEIVDEANEDLEYLVSILEDLGVEVKRPELWDHAKEYASPEWSTDGQSNYCPRDIFLTMGNTIIEAPMTLRCRQFESWSFKTIMIDYLRSGAKWISAPRPRLSDESYHISKTHETVLTDLEPVFDAANVLRLGEDVLYLVSDSGNRLGGQWLQSVLGHDYRVELCDNVYTGTHIDTTFAPIHRGLVVANAQRVGPHNLPRVFSGWDVLYLPDVVDIGCSGIPYTSKWIAMNLLMVRPDLAIVDQFQLPLIRELEHRKVTVVPLQMRHARTLGGGVHCVTLDIRRTPLS